MELSQYRDIVLALKGGFENKFPDVHAQEIDFNLKVVLSPYPHSPPAFCLSYQCSMSSTAATHMEHPY